MQVGDVACFVTCIYSCSDFDFHVTVVLLLPISMTKETYFLPLPFTLSAVQEAVVAVAEAGNPGVSGRAGQCMTHRGGC